MKANELVNNRLRHSFNLLFFILICWIPQSLAQPRPTFIGLEVPPIPNGCEHRESGLLGSSGTFAYERWFCNGREIVVLENFVERRGQHAYMKVIDQITIFASKNGNSALDVPYCSSSSYKDEAVLVLGQWTSLKNGDFVAKNISHAWRFNLQRGKIEPISVRGVKCEGESPD